MDIFNLDSAFLPWILPVIIFTLRVFGIGIDTLRLLFMIRGRKLVVWLLGFVETTLWVVVISGVLANLDNLWNMLAYAAGFATGNVVGMMVEERMALGYVELRVVSTTHDNAVAQAIRNLGHAATEYPARGKDGTVEIIQCSVMRRDLNVIYEEICSVDPKVFITVGEIQPMHRGYWRVR
jgi:uncharacterized protein YebE (UPF0316 family)